MFDTLVTATTDTRGAHAATAWARVEAAACARRLAAMVTLLDTAHAADGSTDRDQWCIDNWAAVCAHIGATARLTPGAASALLLIATALRDRYPTVATLFANGDIDYPMVRTIVGRGLLVTDPAAQRALDTALAHALRDWAPMSQHKTELAIDALIERLDPDAVRRTKTRAQSRGIQVTYDDGSGMAELFGTLFAHDATALNTRLDALADTTCPKDPRTHDQRRSDAMGALAHGADRLACLCDTTNCPAPANPPSTGVIIHLIAHHDTLTTPEDPTDPDDPNPEDPTDPDGDGDGGDGGGGDDSPDNPDSDPETTDSEPEPTDDRATRPAPTDSAPALTDRAAEECAGLDGAAPPMFTTPLREMTLTELYAACDQNPRHPSTIRPAALISGALLPGAIARRAARNATIELIVHPGQAPPEPQHRPSKKLADFVRCRDHTCRYPGCHVPATHCDVDHTIPWPAGPTQASNLKALCRKHHLLKTFWTGQHGWKDRQHPNGDVTWTTPDGREHTTNPGSRLLFPELCQPTAPVIITGPIPPAHTAGLTMPRRQRTRTQDRAYRITHERELNATAATITHTRRKRTTKPTGTEEIPPF